MRRYLVEHTQAINLKTRLDPLCHARQILFLCLLFTADDMVKRRL